jgi:hypothetical protein
MDTAEGIASKPTATRPQQARGQEAEPREAGQQRLRYAITHSIKTPNIGDVGGIASLPGAIGLDASQSSQSSGDSAVEAAGAARFTGSCSSSLCITESLKTLMTSMTSPLGCEGQRR